MPPRTDNADAFMANWTGPANENYFKERERRIRELKARGGRELAPVNGLAEREESGQGSGVDDRDPVISEMEPRWRTLADIPDDPPGGSLRIA